MPCFRDKFIQNGITFNGGGQLSSMISYLDLSARLAWCVRMDQMKQLMCVMSFGSLGGLLNNFQKSGVTDGSSLFPMQAFQAQKPRHMSPAVKDVTEMANLWSEHEPTMIPYTQYGGQSWLPRWCRSGLRTAGKTVLESVQHNRMQFINEAGLIGCRMREKVLYLLFSPLDE